MASSGFVPNPRPARRAGRHPAFAPAAASLAAILAVGCGFPSVEYDAADAGGGDAVSSSLDVGSWAEAGRAGDSAASGVTVDGVGSTTGTSSSEAPPSGTSGPPAGGPGSGVPSASDASDAMAMADAMADAPIAPSVVDAASGPADGVRDAAVTPPDAMVPGAPPDAMARDGMAPPPPDAAPDRPEAAPACDSDGDGYKASGKTCGGNDCDDSDRRAHPGASFLPDAPVAPTAGDWNCDGVVEKRYPVVDCTVVDVASCDMTAGFYVGAGRTEPACGESSTFVQCKAIGKGANGNGAPKLCTTGTFSTATQECR